MVIARDLPLQYTVSSASFLRFSRFLSLFFSGHAWCLPVSRDYAGSRGRRPVLVVDVMLTAAADSHSCCCSRDRKLLLLPVPTPLPPRTATRTVRRCRRRRRRVSSHNRTGNGPYTRPTTIDSTIASKCRHNSVSGILSRPDIIIILILPRGI